MDGKVQRALVSVSDKTGIEGFARALAQMGVEILSTGGTHRLLAATGVPVRDVASYTGFPEMMEGRVKTLHPRVHGGILARRDREDDLEAMRAHGIEPIDLVVVDLYPFERAVAREGVRREEAIEEIDIGGPTLVRAAAKNHAHVAVVVDPADYGAVLDELQREGALGEPLRRRLAAKAFARTAAYDAAIAGWLHAREVEEGRAASRFPERATLAGTKVMDLRYGENPHQAAALYATGETEPSVARAEVLSGKALSYNNLVDLDAALGLAAEFEEPFVCVVKHTNPCGAATGGSLAEALAAAWAGDPVSAFGSVLAANRPVDRAFAEFLLAERRFVEAIVAPSFEADALERLLAGAKWGRSVRLLACGPFGPRARDEATLGTRRLVGGFLLQTRDLAAPDPAAWRVVSRARPTEEQLAALAFAETVAKHVKSNAIVLARDRRVVGVGAGQMSRVDAVRLAAQKAGTRADGAVLASDAFFPFADGVEAAIDAGIGAILEPGGSVRDDEVLRACDARGVPLVFTGTRHFLH